MDIPISPIISILVPPMNWVGIFYKIAVFYKIAMLYDSNGITVLQQGQGNQGQENYFSVVMSFAITDICVLVISLICSIVVIYR